MTERYACDLSKGDVIVDEGVVGTVATTPFIPKRRPGHVSFLVRVGPTMYNVTVMERHTIQVMSHP